MPATHGDGGEMLLVGLLACVGPSWVVRDGLIAGQQVGLAPAWVLGAEITLTVDGWGDPDTWAIVSADPEIVEVMPDLSTDAQAKVPVVAVGVGQTTLSLVVDGETVWHADATVGAPDTMTVVAGPAARVPQYPSLPDPILILGGAEAVIGVRLFDGDTALYGPGTVEAEAEGDLDVSIYAEIDDSQRLGDALDWITVTAASAGVGQIHVDGRTVAATLGVTGVTEDEVVGLDVVVQATDGAKRLDRLSAGAAPTNADGALVLGVEADWQSEGGSGGGDLASFLYRPGDDLAVTVSTGALSREVVLPTDQIYVQESTGLGCDHGRGGAGSTTLGVVALGLIRRRRATALVAACLGLAGCATVYAPARLTAPLLDQAGEIEVTGAFGTAATELTADLALPRGLLLHTGGQWRITDRRRFGVGELGLGAWYAREGSSARLGAQLGVGMGHLDDVVGTASGVDGTWHHSTLLTRLQASAWVGFERPSVGAVLGVRGIGQDYRHDAGSATPDATARWVLLDPALAIRLGAPETKVELGIAYSMIVFRGEPRPAAAWPVSAWAAVVVHPVIFGGPRDGPRP